MFAPLNDYRSYLKITNLYPSIINLHPSITDFILTLRDFLLNYEFKLEIWSVLITLIDLNEFLSLANN